jgi:ABC-type proline/glycine betaine transport system ATPase subunit
MWGEWFGVKVTEYRYVAELERGGLYQRAGLARPMKSTLNAREGMTCVLHRVTF